MLTNYIVYRLLRCLCILPFFCINRSLLSIYFTEVITIPMEVAVMVKSRLETIVQVKENNEHSIQNHINSKEENHFVKNISKLYFVIYRLSGWIFWGKLHR